MNGRGIRIAAIRLLCGDLEKAACFYERAFAFRRSRWPNGLALHLGEQRVELEETANLCSGPAPANATAFQHFAMVATDMDAAYRRLGDVSGWSAISRAGPQRLPVTSGGVTAFKFRDCDGHPLELLAFPPEAIPPAWQHRDGLFLGIDHTAIAVADSERSIAYYAQFGFAVVSRSLNRGPEQARLDSLDEPVVEVTALRPPGGVPPHLELLCYGQPRPPRTEAPSDNVLATRTVLADAENIDDAGCEPETIRADPDGHRLLIRR